MSNSIELKKRIFDAIASLLEDKTQKIEDETPLIGDGSILDSMKLVEVCLALEDLAPEYGFEFDWTSESAMSNVRSMFRTAGTLAAEFIAQSENKK